MTTRIRLYLTLGLGLAGTVAWQLLFPHPEHVIYWFHRVPGFDVLLGLAGAFLLVWLPKTLGEYFLQRGEDYYER